MVEADVLTPTFGPYLYFLPGFFARVVITIVAGHISSPTYSVTADRSEHVLQSMDSPQGLIASSRGDWMFTTDHMSINLGPRLWDPYVPSYGLNGKVDCSVEFTGEQCHVERVTATLEGKLATSTTERGSISGQYTQPLFSQTVVLYSRHTRAFDWGREATFSISFPTEVDTRLGISNLPPSVSIWHPSARAEVSYTLRFEMARKGFRRHETKIVPILYLPKSRPSQSPLTSIPLLRRNLAETPFPVSDRIKNIALSVYYPKGHGSSEHPTESAYLSLPSPLSFVSGELIPFTISLVCRDTPALAQLLAPHVQVKFIKRARIWFNSGRDISVRDVCLRTADLWQVDQPTEGINILRGSIQAGAAGHESSWQVDGVAEVQYALRVAITPPKHFEGHCPTFKHDEMIDVTTDPWGTLERELVATGGIPTPALALAASVELRRSLSST